MIRRYLVCGMLLAVSSAFAQRHMHNVPPTGRAEKFRRFGQNFDGPAILKKAFAASESLRYVGTRVVEFRRNGSITRHSETIIRDGRFVRIEFPEGSPMSGQIIVENGQERRHFFPDKNEIHVLPPRRDEAFGRLGRILTHRDRYSLTTANGEPVAGIRTEQVVVSDKSGNVLQRLYIDPQSGLILKRNLFDPVGTPVGGFEYERVDLSPRIDPRVFTIRRRGAKIVTPSDMLESLAKQHGFLPMVLPPSTGYRLEMSMAPNIHGKEVLVSFYRSVDGHRLTLHQLKANVSPSQIRDFAQSQNLQSYSWTFQGNTFVLIGNVDEKILQKMAKPIGG